MADPLRHRQTKGAATDMVDLTPPRHIPTLPTAADSRTIKDGPQSLRVFGRLPVTGVKGRTEAGVRKASREETAEEFAPTLVSLYGEFAAAARSDLSVPNRTTVE
jgi:hypothetical protein